MYPKYFLVCEVRTDIALMSPHVGFAGVPYIIMKYID
jgi:hypothetical protein